MTTGIDPFQLYGTRETDTPPVRLTAGRLAVDFKDGNLRTIKYDGAEVLRAVSYLVRDRDWGTYAPSISDLQIDQRLDAFGFDVAVLGHRVFEELLQALHCASAPSRVVELLDPVLGLTFVLAANERRRDEDRRGEARAEHQRADERRDGARGSHGSSF